MRFADVASYELARAVGSADDLQVRFQAVEDRHVVPLEARVAGGIGLGREGTAPSIGVGTRAGRGT
jgi:hypothetical protein